MNGVRWLFFCGFLLAGLASGWSWGWWQAQRRQEAAADRLRGLLQAAEVHAQPARLFEPRMRAIVRRCLGAKLDAALLAELRRLPLARFSVFLFDHRYRMWSRRAWGIEDPPMVWRPTNWRKGRFQKVPFDSVVESLFRVLASPLLRPQGYPSGWLFDGWEAAFELKLQGLPGRFQTLVEHQDSLEMGLWDWRPMSDPERVAGVLVRGCLPFEQRHLLAKTYLAGLRRRGHQVWFYDLGAWRGEPRGLPSAIGPASLAAILDASLRGPGDLVDLDGQQIVYVPFEDRFLLCGLVPTPSVVIPRSWLFLMVAGLALAWRLSLAGSPGLGFPWSLGTTMAVVLGLAVGIPLLLIAWFWQGFAANRTAAAWARSAQDAERHLIEIDRRFPAWLRGIEARLQDWADRFSQELAKGIPPLLPLPADHPLGERGRAFPADSSLARLVDETIAMERQGLFDTLFLVSSQGLVLRDLSLEKKGSRRLSLLPRRERVRQLLCRIERGGDRHLAVVREVLQAPAGGLNWRAWNDLRDTRNPVVVRHVAEAMRELLRYSGLLVEPSGPRGEVRQETVAVMMEAMPGFLGWDPIRRLASSLGRMIGLSMEGVTSRGCGFALLGPTGRAEFGAMAFYASTLPEETYLRQVLRDRPAGGPAGPQVLALALDPNTPHQPQPFLHRRWGRLPSFIVPPRRSWNGRWRDEAGRAFLLVAVRPSQIHGYLLLSLIPEARVAEAVAALHRDLGLAGLTLALLLGLVGWRWWVGVGRPAQAIMAGLDAIEQQRWTHRIPPLGTDDEWEQLAKAFNGALASLEELAVAAIVQEKLLPQEPVQAGGWRFEGRSVMTSQVGGDYFDALPTPGGCLAFVVGDVAGHGVQAALVMGVMRSGFGAVVAAGIDRPAAILERLNDLLFRAIRQHPMMTMLAGVAHPDGRLVMANAGQVTPLLLEPPRDHPSPGMTPAAARHEPSRTEEATPTRAEGPIGTVRPLRALVGLPLGIRPRGRPRAEHELTLSGPVRLILCSDGVIEARNPAGACFTLDGLTAAVASLGARPAPAIIAAVQERLRAFAAGRPWEDDVTVAVLSRE